MKTAEQEARDMLECMGVKHAQSLSASDVMPIANLISDSKIIETQEPNPTYPIYGEWVLVWLEGLQRPVIGRRMKTDINGDWYELEKGISIFGNSELVNNVTHFKPLPTLNIK